MNDKVRGHAQAFRHSVNREKLYRHSTYRFLNRRRSSVQSADFRASERLSVQSAEIRASERLSVQSAEIRASVQSSVQSAEGI